MLAWSVFALLKGQALVGRASCLGWLRRPEAPQFREPHHRVWIRRYP
jgi:hypothetical protein